MNVGDVTGPRWVSGGVGEAAFRESSARLSGALSDVARERDEALKALGESRQRFADSETKRAELEAALSGISELADKAEHGALRWADPLPVPEWVPRVRALLVPLVVLQDHDAAVWDDGFTACAHEHMKQRGNPWYPITRTNPYRADQDEQ